MKCVFFHGVHYVVKNLFIYLVLTVMYIHYLKKAFSSTFSVAKSQQIDLQCIQEKGEIDESSIVLLHLVKMFSSFSNYVFCTMSFKLCLLNYVNTKLYQCMPVCYPLCKMIINYKWSYAVTMCIVLVSIRPILVFIE